MKSIVRLTLALLAVGAGGQLSVNSATSMAQKPRAVLTHDPELDDVNTLIRAMLASVWCRPEVPPSRFNLRLRRLVAVEVWHAAAGSSLRKQHR